MVGVCRLGMFLEVARVGSGADRVLSPWVERGARPPPDVIAVTVGPGAFTGIRVGVAHALGLAVALGVEVVPLSSLAVRSLIAPGHARVTVVLDAKKGRVYTCTYDTSGDVPRALGPELDVVPEALTGGGLVVGEGAVVHRGVLEAAGFVVHPEACVLPLDLAGRLVAESPSMDAARVIPHYLREPDARRLT